MFGVLILSSNPFENALKLLMLTISCFKGTVPYFTSVTCERTKSDKPEANGALILSPITLNSLAISARFYAYSVGYCLKNEYHQV